MFISLRACKASGSACPTNSRAEALMADPNEAKRVQTWMQQFGMSNQGFEFNQAKMNQGMMPMPGMPPQGA